MFGWNPEQSFCQVFVVSGIIVECQPQTFEGFDKKLAAEPTLLHIFLVACLKSGLFQVRFMIL